MSLWGNNDNLTSSGTVSLNYDTGVVTGSGTTFGTVGFGVTGDVIRFGSRGSGGVYFGDAVIVSTASTLSVTIGSTAGLSGATISGAEYKLSQLPKSSILDHHYSNKLDGAPEFVNISAEPPIEASGATRTIFGSGSTNGIGASVLPVNTLFFDPISVGDFFVSGDDKIQITGIQTGSVSIQNLSPVGFLTVYATIPDGADIIGSTVSHVTSGVSTDLGTIAALNQGKVGAANTAFTLSSGLAFALKKGDDLSFTNSPFIVSIASTASVGLSTGDTLQFQRIKGGYDKQIYGIGTSAYDDVSTAYRTSGTGWVGVTTYVDCHGNFRVKSEVLVAMGTPHEDSTSGIQTGTGSILYPTPV